MTISVSVAMCAFNGERFIGEQLASILQQTMLPTEVVVADDGSSDRTIEIVKQYAQRAEVRGVGVKILGPQSDPLGVTRNFERCMLACAGEYIALADQDDLWCPRRIEAGIRALDEANAVLGAHNATLIDGSGHDLGKTHFEAMRVSQTELDQYNSGDSFTAAVRRNPLPGMGFIVKRDFLASVAPVPDRWMHDWYLVLRAAERGALLVSDDASLLKYRLHDSNVAATKGGLLKRIQRATRRRGEPARRVAKFESLRESFAGMENSQAANLLARKIEFERWRSGLSRNPVVRTMEVGRAMRADEYSQSASAGRLTAAQDVLLRPYRPDELARRQN